MIITKAQDYSNFLVQSQLIQDWVSDDSIVVNLKIYEACSTSAITILLSDDTYDTEDEGMIITPTLLDQTTDTIADGIYRLELISDNGDEITEKYCLFIEGNIKCRIVTYLGDNLNSNIYHLYLVLLDGEACMDCNCKNLCLIYDEINRLLDITNTEPCGCS